MDLVTGFRVMGVPNNTCANGMARRKRQHVPAVVCRTVYETGCSRFREAFAAFLFPVFFVAALRAVVRFTRPVVGVFPADFFFVELRVVGFLVDLRAVGFLPTFFLAFFLRTATFEVSVVADRLDELFRLSAGVFFFFTDVFFFAEDAFLALRLD